VETNAAKENDGHHQESVSQPSTPTPAATISKPAAVEARSINRAANQRNDQRDGPEHSSHREDGGFDLADDRNQEQLYDDAVRKITRSYSQS
jgi:hypothetical protein